MCSNHAVLDCGCDLNVETGCGAKASNKLHVMNGTGEVTVKWYRQFVIQDVPQ